MSAGHHHSEGDHHHHRHHRDHNDHYYDDDHHLQKDHHNVHPTNTDVSRGAQHPPIPPPPPLPTRDNNGNYNNLVTTQKDRLKHNDVSGIEDHSRDSSIPFGNPVIPMKDNSGHGMNNNNLSSIHHQDNQNIISTVHNDRGADFAEKLKEKKMQLNKTQSKEFNNEPNKGFDMNLDKGNKGFDKESNKGFDMNLDKGDQGFIKDKGLEKDRGVHSNRLEDQLNQKRREMNLDESEKKPQTSVVSTPLSGNQSNISCGVDSGIKHEGNIINKDSNPPANNNSKKFDVDNLTCF